MKISFYHWGVQCPIIFEMLRLFQNDMVDNVKCIDISKDIQVGNKVKIMDGPFKDMIGKIAEVNMKEQKLIVMVDLFGQETSVEVEISQVEGM